MECGWKLICLTQDVDAVNGILMNIDFARKIRMFENIIKIITNFLRKMFWKNMLLRSRKYCSVCIQMTFSENQPNGDKLLKIFHKVCTIFYSILRWDFFLFVFHMTSFILLNLMISKLHEKWMKFVLKNSTDLFLKQFFLTRFIINFYYRW